MGIESVGGKYEGVWINRLKNGNTSFYINYRDETGQVIKKKVGIKTKQSNYTVWDAYDRLIEVKHKITTGGELPKKRLYQLAVLLLFTGARFSEVARLTWSDINFNTNLIYFGPSKDGNARYIKMTTRVLEVLNLLELEKINQLVIPTKYGNMYDKMPKRWQTIVDKLIEDNKTANKNRITVHTLRHTHASWLAQSGVDILHIKEQLGHKKIETTMRYCHLIDNKRHEATEKLDF